MKHPPVRAEKSLFSKSSVCSIAFFGLYITAVTLGVYALALNLWGNEVATALTFLTISFAELFQAFNIRSEGTLFGAGFLSNKILLATVFVGIAINVALVFTPLAGAFGLCKLNAAQWLTVFGFAISVIPVGEVYKLFARIISRRRKA